MNKVSWWRTSFNEEVIEKIKNSILSGHISQGVVTEQFEKLIAEFLDIPYVVATTSGSVSLLMSMIALNIKPGDEVIIPNRTWIATAHAPYILGAKIILVDVLPDKPILDVSKITEKITPRTKAIIPVHLNGRSVDMIEIKKIAEDFNLYVVEDACQAFSSKNSQGFLGTQSDIGCYSLGILKLISTAQGGLIVTKNKDIYEKLKLIRNNGVVNNINPIYETVGSNFKFTDIQSSIGIAQLSQIQEKITNIKKIYEKYKETLESSSHFKLIPVKFLEGELPIYIEILCKERDKLINYLQSNNIESRPFLPSIDSALYLNNTNELPNSKIFSERGIFLPSGPAQTNENIEYVLKILRAFDNFDN